MVLEVIKKNEAVVVDSRLIAKELGIEHKTLKIAISNYIIDLTELGTLNTRPLAVSLNTGLLLKKNSPGTEGEVYYYLSESKDNEGIYCLKLDEAFLSIL